MSASKDTLHRLFTLLRMVPRHPRGISSSELLQQLRDKGFSVGLRSVQRDLHSLSCIFPLMSNDTPPYSWSFQADAPLDLAALDSTTALTLHLAEGHLKTVLPHSMLAQLEPQFVNARNYLNSIGDNGVSHWVRRVRTLPNGKALLAAQITQDIWPPASTALLERKQLRIQYRSRSKNDQKTLLLHPAGLVSRHVISYLLANVDGYHDIRQFALHRILHAECLDTSANQHPGFDVDGYIQNGGFNSPAPVEQVELVADVSPQIAWLLSETPLSTEQSLEPLPNSDWQRLRAWVPDDQETLWWVFGLGENIRVLEPESWAMKIRKRAADLEALYA